MPCTPDTVPNCASCATNAVLSIGFSGSWFFSCALISVRKSVTFRSLAVLCLLAGALAMPAAAAALAMSLTVLMVRMAPVGFSPGPA